MALPPATGAPSGAVPDPETELTAFLGRLQGHLGLATRSAAALPSGSDLAFHTTLDRSLARLAEDQADQVLHTFGRVLEWVAEAAPTSAQRRGGLRPNPVTEGRQVAADEFAATMGDAVDHLLERTDTLLDEYTGRAANQTQAEGSKSKKSTATSMRDKNLPLPSHILRAPIEPRPQDAFVETKPDNQPDTPWNRPLRFGQPHTLTRPDDWQPPVPVNPDGQVIPEGRRMGTYVMEDDARKHPYYYEISQSTPPQHAFVLPKPADEESKEESTEDVPTLVVPTPLDIDNAAGEAGVPFTWVSNKAGLDALLAHLLEPRVKEIAIDLEHHSLHSYQGLTSLMQLSTRWGDFIVDTLQDEVRVHAEQLNQAFADPSKVKVLHGADADVIWLQRDLGLYLVGLFDTFHAAKALSFSQRGLAYLLSRYTGFDPDKRFQLADWRIRPLPAEMLYYARSDTHNLLYVYDRLRAELAATKGFDGIRDVFRRSKSVAFKVYTKPDWAEDGSGSDGWGSLYRRYLNQAIKSLPPRTPEKELEQQADAGWSLLKTMLVLRELHHWRDNVARQEDESSGSILGLNPLTQLAHVAPTTRPGVTGALSGKLTPMIRRHQDEIGPVVQEAFNRFDQAVQKAVENTQAESTEQLIEQIRTAARLLHLPKSVVRDMLRAASIQEGKPTRALAQLLAEGSESSSGFTKPGTTAEAEAQLKRLVTDGPRVNPALFTSLAGPQTAYSALFARDAAPTPALQPAPAAPKSLFELPATAFGLNAPAVTGEEDEQPEQDPEVLDSILKDFAFAVAPLLSTEQAPAPAPAPAPDAQDNNTPMEPESVAFVPAEQRTSAMGNGEAISARAPPVPAPEPPKKEDDDVEMLDDEVKLREALERDSVHVRKGQKQQHKPKSQSRGEVAQHDFSQETSLLDQKRPKQQKKLDKGKKSQKDEKAKSSTSKATPSTKTPAPARPVRKNKEFGSKSATFNK